MAELMFGHLTASAVGIILKEALRRAMTVARAERKVFEAHGKLGYGGTMDDVFTTADRKAQEIYLRVFAECFPDFGIIAEENNHFKPSRNGMYLTVDPLDGTKAYIRRQSHGIGSMVALVANGVVISAYVGDMCANELFGYRPESDEVHRITDLDPFGQLGDASQNMRASGEAHILLRDPLNEYSTKSQVLVSKYKSHEIMGSSIGTWAARLWKGEVQALLLRPGYETPWDSTPVFGISQKLGYKFYRPGLADEGWIEFVPDLPTETLRRPHDMLITCM